MTLHVRYEGRSFDVPFQTLGLHSTAGDAAVKKALARHLDIPANRLDGYVIDRVPSGNLILRPEAVYG